MAKTPQKYKDKRTIYQNSINSKLDNYKKTYPAYMNHVYSDPMKQDINQYCEAQTNQETEECSNIKAKADIDQVITNMRTDINDITNELKLLGKNATSINNKFNKNELEYAIEQNKLKNIKQKNAESIMMKKITEDNQAINIVESIYLVAGISFMGFFIWKQLNK